MNFLAFCLVFLFLLPLFTLFDVYRNKTLTFLKPMKSELTHGFWPHAIYLSRTLNINLNSNLFHLFYLSLMRLLT